MQSNRKKSANLKEAIVLQKIKPTAGIQRI